MPSIPFLCLPPSRVDPKVLGLNVLICHSQPGGSWMTRRSPPIRWWSQRGGDDTVVVRRVMHNGLIDPLTHTKRPMRPLCMALQTQWFKEITLSVGPRFRQADLQQLWGPMFRGSWSVEQPSNWSQDKRTSAMTMHFKRLLKTYLFAC